MRSPQETIKEYLRCGVELNESALEYGSYMRKLFASMPKIVYKRNHVTFPKECLELFNFNPEEFFRRFISVDKTWILHNRPETKKQTKEAQMDLSSNRTMAAVF